MKGSIHSVSFAFVIANGTRDDWQEPHLLYASAAAERTRILREVQILAEGSQINGLFVFVTVSQHAGSRVSQPFLPTPSPEIAAKLQP